MQFDEFRRRVADGHDVFVPPDWTQGRTVFGGLSAGLLCEAVQQGVADDRRLRYLDVAFQRPLAPDVPFTVEVGH